MTIKLTRERLEELAAGQSGFNLRIATLEESQELARMALAAMDSDPVAYMHDGEDGTEYNGHNEFSGGGKGIPLYRHAQPAPVVMAEAQSRAAFEQWCTVNIERNKWHPEFYAHLPVREQWAAWEACRAAMLDRQLVDHVDEELLITIKTASALDSLPKTGEVQNTNSPVVPDCSAVAALTGIPMIPDGYVIVPKVATEKMLIAGLEEADPLGSLIDWNASRGDCNTREQVQGMFEAMLAAAPQSPGGDHATVPGKWIPVSEQMPPSRHEVLVGRWWGEKPRWCCKWATYIPGHPDAQSSGWLIPGASWTPTHWMPLPAAPQEVNRE
nr:DUF551 domain-containing protein [Klebsiella pneumoniae]